MRYGWRSAVATTAVTVAVAGWGVAGLVDAPGRDPVGRAVPVASEAPAAKIAHAIDLPEPARAAPRSTTTTTAPPPPPTTTTTTAPPGPPPEDVTFPVADAAGSSVALYDGPGAAAPTGSLANPQPYAVPLSFRVLEKRGDWLHVAIPTRPNGATAWVRAGEVTMRSVPNRVVAELGARRVTVFDGASDRVLFQAPVAIGAPGTPTPTGDLYYVDAIRATGNPGGVYGPYQMRISAFSEVLYSFNGGPGQVAFHGTNSPGLIGSAVSNGCLRMYNADITTLVSLAPVGTPVRIVP